MKINSSRGFTLIELIVVIVIPGILAAVAAPKFMDLQSDAKAVSLKGLEAALKSFDEMVYAKAVMQGQEKLSWNNSSVDIGSDVPVSTWYGHIDPYDAFFELLDKPVNECSMLCLQCRLDWN